MWKFLTFSGAFCLLAGFFTNSLQEKPQVPLDTLPADFEQRPSPEGLPRGFGENPVETEAVIRLGRKLFFSPALSRDQSVACVSCHLPNHGFAHPDPTPPGISGRRPPRHAPSVFNRAWSTHQFWDGRSATLEEQVLTPIENKDEMDLPLDAAIQRLNADREFLSAFTSAFGGPADRSRLARALAAFLRRLTHGDTPIDRFRDGDSAVLSDSERAGLWIFESSGRCWRCHSGANFTDESFHNTGVAARSGGRDNGREQVTGRAEDRGRFKTPSLRGVALSAPFMHDGSLGTLRDVVEFYRRGGHSNDHLDPLMRPLDMSDRDVDHLVAFLEALSRDGRVAPK